MTVILPKIEFEGPMGNFWLMEEVPMKALIIGASVIIDELHQRGYRDDVILQLIKDHSDLVVKHKS